MTEWIDDVRRWPKLEFQDIYQYFVSMPACDNQPNRNYRSISEGMNYLDSGWVGVVTHRIVGPNIILRCRVRYSQSISNCHHVEITVNILESRIVGVKCDCIASEGNCCSHSAGLAFKINEANKKGYIGVACTDVSCTWNRSTGKNVVPDTVENIRGDINVSMARTVVAFESDKEVIDHLRQEHMNELTKIPGTIINNMRTATHKPPPQPDNITSLDQPIIHGSHEIPLQCSACKQVFERYVLLTDIQRQSLASKTNNQKCALWTSQRKLRVTSSCAASVPKRQDTDPSRWIRNHLDPSFSGNSCTAHGLKYEQTARDQFQRESACHVNQEGLLVSAEESWLGASLDGRIDEHTILEIKCPTSQKLAKYGHSLSRLLDSGSYHVRRKEDGTYFLRQSTADNGYYMQVQIAMHCAQASMCKFMVWTSSEAVTVDVPYDQQWITKQITRLEEFYFRNLLPAITDGIHSRSVKVVEFSY